MYPIRSHVISASYSCSAELNEEKNWGYRVQRRGISEPANNLRQNTYVTTDELVLSEEAKVWRLVPREVPTQWEEIPEAIADDLQAGQSARRAWLECGIVTTERWVKVVNGNREWSRTVAGAALCKIRDGRLSHESLLLVPERLFVRCW